MDITISLNNIDKAIKELEEYKKTFNDNVTELVTELTEYGADKASQNFKSAQYDGTNDVYVNSSVGRKSKNKVVGEIEADGSAVLFIEFGTGVFYGNAHPEAYDHGYFPGSYGPNGLENTWGYYGEGGTNGVYRKTTDKGDLYTTHGNPANRCLYDAGKAIEAQAPRIAREVFK